MDVLYTAEATARGGRNGSALTIVAGKRKIDVTGSEITARVGIGPDGRAFRLTAALTGRFPTLSLDEGRALMEAAHEVCPYSRATRGNMEVTFDVE
jgi:osmotically inducible protein OsmC